MVKVQIGTGVFTASGFQLVEADSGDDRFRISINVTATSGSPTLQFTCYAVDPIDLTTQIGPSVQSTVISSTGTQIIELPLTEFGSTARISWVFGGTGSVTASVALVGVFGSGIRNTISKLNSTSTALGISGVFTGSWESCEHFADIGVMIKASHASATNGFLVEQSSDGVNVDSDDAFTLPANSGKYWNVPAQGKYFRVKLTNGTTAQSYLRLQTKLHMVRGKPSAHRVQDSIISDDDAELVKSVLTAKKPDGTFVNMTADDQGNFRVTVISATGNAQQAVRSAVLNGGSSSLLVDGNPTPVVFTYPSDSLKDLRIYEIRFVFAANSTPFGANKFGPAVGGLANGVLLEIVSNGVTTELANIKINEDFLVLQPSVNLFVDQTGSSDVITAGLDLGGLMVLKAGTSDVVKVTVRDDISGLGGTPYLRCYVYGLKDQ